MAQRLISILYPHPTVDAKLTTQEAMKIVSEARDEYIRMSILRAKVDTNIVAGNWLSEFSGVKVEWDDKKNKWYSHLPAGVITLPNDMGVYHVFFDNNDIDMFIPVTSAMRSMYRGSLAQYLEGDYGYFLLEDLIWYTQDMPEDCTVSMHLVAQSEDLGEYDYFPLDGSGVQAVLERAMALAGTQKQIPSDGINDGLSN